MTIRVAAYRSKCGHPACDRWIEKNELIVDVRDGRGWRHAGCAKAIPAEDSNISALYVDREQPLPVSYLPRAA